MDQTKDREHLLALKVMRLTKPTLLVSTPRLQCDPWDLPKDSFEHSNKLELNVLPRFQSVTLEELLVLPQNFGNIFLGETFSSYVSINNGSGQTCHDVTVKAELQTSSQRVMLSRAGSMSRTELEPGASIDEIIHHEVKELGTHILMCTVTYSNATGESLNFRKFFKFHVLKPLDVKTKFYNTDIGDVYLEAQIQNQTLGPIFLEKVILEPCPPYSVEPLNSLPGSNKQDSVFEPFNYIGSQDTKQYLYRLLNRGSTSLPSNTKDDVDDAQNQSSNLGQSPSSSPHHLQVNKGITNMGKLDIIWKSCMGEKGRLQTSQLQKVTHGSGDMRVTVVEAPGEVTVGKMYPIVVCITNCCERSMDLVVMLHNNNKFGFSWIGVSGQKIGKLESGSSVDLNFDLMTLTSGLISISGLHITDQFLKRTYEHDDFFQILSHVPHGDLIN